jgi:hypothetical protein
VLAATHQAGTPKGAELLRKMGRLKPDFGDELADGQLLIAEKLKDADAGWVAQCLEEVGFHLVDRASHSRPPSVAIDTKRTPDNFIPLSK